MLGDILKEIDEAIETYNSMSLDDIKLQSDCLRKLTTNLYRLEGFRIEAKEMWLSVYFSKAGTNAAREKISDNEVKDLYRIRRLLDSGYKVADSIRSTIGVYKKDS